MEAQSPAPYAFSEKDRLKAVSPEARKRRRNTLARHAQSRREDALALHRYGYVDGVIAEKIGVSEATIANWLKDKRVRPRYGRGYITKGDS